jgi:drug/metabolite transporter (DMT)-like permease
MEALSSHRRGQLYVALGAIAWSTAGVLQRELTVDTPTQLSGRALFAFAALVLYVWAVQPGSVVGSFRAIGRPGLAVAVCMATASGAFIVALNHTTVAHVLFIQAVAPVLAALLAWLFLHEPVSGRSWLAMAIALGGVVVMVGSPSSFDPLGDGVSLVMSLSFAIAIVITRHRRDVSMAPATCLAQLLLLLVFAPFSTPGAVTRHDLAFLVLIGAVQMGLGLALFTVGARLIPAAEVALITLLEVVLGPLWVWLAFSERPDAATLAGGAIVLVAVLVQASGEFRLPETRRAEAAPPPP